MTNETNKNLKVIGEGSYPGGNYGKIKITGQGKITEDVCSKETKITGRYHINGNATMNQVNVTGGLTVDEALNSNRINWRAKR